MWSSTVWLIDIVYSMSGIFLNPIRTLKEEKNRCIVTLKKTRTLFTSFAILLCLSLLHIRFLQMYGTLEGSQHWVSSQRSSMTLLGSKQAWKSMAPTRLSQKSGQCFCLFSKVKSDNDDTKVTPVCLNVYDLTPMNGYVYWAGLGIFHSGVEGGFSCIHNTVTRFGLLNLIWG